MSVTFNVDTIRIVIHVLAVTVWLGGQVAIMALVPVLRSSGVDGLAAKGARAFQAVAWPAFGVIVATGIWNLLAVGTSDNSTGYNMVFGIKFLFVIISGVAAWMHSRPGNTPLMRAITGAVGFVAALIAFVLGYAMSVQ